MVALALVMSVLVIATVIAYCVQEKCPAGGLHRWKKTGSEWAVGCLATHQECRKCGKKVVAVPMKAPPY